MRGFPALGVERLFWDRQEHTLVAIIRFGPALSGWPGVTHGGAIATVLAEKMALAASLSSPSLADDAGTGSVGVSEAAVPQRMPGVGGHAKMFAPSLTQGSGGEQLSLSLSYVKPTYANNVYVVRVSPSIDLAQEEKPHVVPDEPMGSSAAGTEYEATLETMDGRILVKAKARFAPPSRSGDSTLQRMEEEVAEVGRKTYTEFKEWMWPSRQQQSSQAG
ncbi:hypothetical protein BAUCODRAFT_36137 [Baudoinia panamericana UAMH 10762]|uniref:Thioesterase domain-containing protein n=1 Tax=Baudoinia panamericana (strain UAMH 10762) TaxID=717646 RepID=M2N7S9_BAUPA|nr:uncharacterized protein BAUCODRAFT_36137 [Baudoinia panamericana UAMH 10762]EMC94860.1 hypothetical protein BAUCODRAFT_36137 [Baudoinia panamericana UAMH 10762]